MRWLIENRNNRINKRTMTNEAIFDNAIDLAPLHTFTALFDLPQHDIEALLNEQTTDYCDYYNSDFSYGYESHYQYNYSPPSSASSSPGPIGDMFGVYDYQPQFNQHYYQSTSPTQYQSSSPAHYHSTSPAEETRKMRPPKRTSPTTTMSSGIYANAEKDVDIDALIIKVRSARVKLGFTQAEFAKSMKNIFKRSFSQTTVCRFEGKQLTKQNMLKLVPLFDKWLSHCNNDTDYVRRSIC